MFKGDTTAPLSDTPLPPEQQKPRKASEYLQSWQTQPEMMLTTQTSKRSQESPGLHGICTWLNQRSSYYTAACFEHCFRRLVGVVLKTPQASCELTSYRMKSTSIYIVLNRLQREGRSVPYRDGSSFMLAFLAVHLSPTLTWVWAMTLITWQYFFMLLKSFSNCFLPSSSCHFLQYLVKAFFLDLCLQKQSRDKVGLSPSSIPRWVGTSGRSCHLSWFWLIARF